MDLEAKVRAQIEAGALKVPPAPKVALELLRLVGDERSSLERLVATVGRDQALAGTVLKLANSAALRRPDVVALRTAVLLLGRRTLKELAFTQALHGEVLTRGPLLPLRRRAWRESLVAAQVAQWCAELEGHDAEEAFVLGLLHDVGRVPAIGCLEEALSAAGPAAPRPEAEWWEAVEGVHVELGRVVAAQWALPARLSAAIAQHHEEDVGGTVRMVVAADAVVRLLDAHPSLTPAHLEGLAMLSPRSRVDLARRLPLLPVYLDAFTEAEGGAEQPHAVRGAVADLGGRGGEPLSVLTGGVSTAAEVLGRSPRAVVVRLPLKVGQLVRARAGELQFHARVQGCEGGRSELAPWALDAAQRKGWERFSGGG